MIRTKDEKSLMDRINLPDKNVLTRGDLNEETFKILFEYSTRDLDGSKSVRNVKHFKFEYKEREYTPENLLLFWSYYRHPDILTLSERDFVAHNREIYDAFINTVFKLPEQSSSKYWCIRMYSYPAGFTFYMFKVDTHFVVLTYDDEKFEDDNKHIFATYFESDN